MNRKLGGTESHCKSRGLHFVYGKGNENHQLKNAEALVVVSKEIGLEMNADKTKYMIMS